MPAPRFDAEFACNVLLDAAFMSDKDAAEKHGVSRRSVINYRNRLKSDPEFALLFTRRLEELKKKMDWEGRMPLAIRRAIEAMEACFKEPDTKNPDYLVAVSKAFQVLTDVQLTVRMLNARFNGNLQAGAEGAADRQIFASPAAEA